MFWMTWSYENMSDSMEDKVRIKRTTIILYVLMAIAILLPFLLLWIRR
jgi:hypothetical protein